MAGLVAGQLAEDGTYPNAGAVLEGEDRSDGALAKRQTVTDYAFNPDQPTLEADGRRAEANSDTRQS